jgi:tetratricopeptide (TPR) repeat protein
MSYRRKILAALVLILLSFSALMAQSRRNEVARSALQQAASEFQHDKVTEAEQTLRGALKQAPRDPAALGLLGVILDAQKRYGEAEVTYQQALALVPGSPALLNNLGNHYLAQGKTEPARAAYLKVVAADPRHPNANLQLAQMSVAAKRGQAALRYLNRLPSREQGTLPVQLLRAQALYLSGQQAAATDLLAQVEKQAPADPQVAFSIGLIFVDWQRYADAENAFTRALDADPTNFDMLYNLGLAAQHAGHLTRALEVYRVALKQRPNDADCLFNLAAIYTQTGHSDEAIVPLMQAHNAAPERPDILFALAQTSQDLGFYADAATAIDQYLKLKPNDDIARRERGFCLIRSAKLDQGLEDLRWYTQKHPKDPRGFYELAIAETVRESDKALQHFNQALAIDPKFNAARYARAVLYYQEGKTEESIADLKLVLTTEPDDTGSLDALGQDYMRLAQYAAAAEVLERAIKLAPKDPKILTHYSRVLIRLGRKEEAEKVMADFRALGPEEGRRRPYGGLFDFLNLPPEQQYAKYMENLQRTITTRPDDPSLRVQLGRTLLRQGKPDEAIEAFRTARKLTSNPDVLATCGKALFDFGQYGAAREFLEPAVAAHPSAADLRLDLAIAVFHSASARDALTALDESPPQERKGDYFLLRAQILDAMQMPEQAAEALNRAFDAAPTRADLYFEGALFLIKHKQYHRAVRLLEQASRALPDAPELLLTLAMAYDMVQQYEDSARLLAQIESRWPEWSLPYELQGISLETRLRSEQAKPLLETALALGARDPNVYYYLASAITHATPEDTESAQKAIGQALQLNPDDAYIRSLAGKIAYTRKDYPAALEHLTAALRLWPEMVEAHQTLAGVYRALGEREKSAAELKEIVRIKQANPTADQAPPFPVGDLLFTVRPPARPPS